MIASRTDGGQKNRGRTIGQRAIIAVRVILGAIFVYAGLSKFGNPQAFADSIASFKIVPSAAVNLVAMGLPVFEVAAGVITVAGRPRGVGTTAIALLCGIFSAALVQALVRGLAVDCGCFGSGTPSAGGTAFALVRAIAIGAAAAWISRYETL